MAFALNSLDTRISPTSIKEVLRDSVADCCRRCWRCRTMFFQALRSRWEISVLIQDGSCQFRKGISPRD